jgi:hypothetical protein
MNHTNCCEGGLFLLYLPDTRLVLRAHLKVIDDGPLLCDAASRDFQ